LLIGVYYDMMRAVFPAERLARLLGEDGVEAVRALAASDLPNFDFHFDTTPDFAPQDAERAKSLEQLLQTIEARPWAVDITAEVNKFSPSIVRKARGQFQQFQTQQAEAAAQAAAQAPVKSGPEQNKQQTPSQMVESLTSGVLQ
jgi:FtsZ-interacting cell division protein ZipA